MGRPWIIPYKTHLLYEMQAIKMKDTGIPGEIRRFLCIQFYVNINQYDNVICCRGP